jgi:hypothetical protein
VSAYRRVGVGENSIKPPSFFHWIESTRVNLNLFEIHRKHEKLDASGDLDLFERQRGGRASQMALADF